MRFISPREAAERINKTEQHVTRMLRQGKLSGQQLRRGAMTYWEVDTECSEYRRLLPATPAASGGTNTRIAINWDDWEYMVTSGAGNLVRDPLSPRSVGEYRAALDRFFAKYSDVSVRNLHAAYKEYLDKRTDETDFYTPRKHLYYSLLTVARYYRHKGEVSEAFVQELEQQKPKRLIPPRRQVAYDKATVDAALKRIEKNHMYDRYEKALNRALVMIGFITCLRNAEIRHLRPQDVDFDGMTFPGQPSIYVYKGKGRKERHVPLPPALAETIKEYLTVRPESGSKHLFLSDRGTQLTAKGVCEKLERLGLTSHGLRRSGATYLAKERGVAIGVVSELLGHTDLKTTSLYVKDSARAVVSTLNQVYSA